MKRFRLFIDIDKEEAYLNKMAKQGYSLKEVKDFGPYVFQKDAKAQASYKIDIREKMTDDQYQDYLAMFEDFGWHKVSGHKDSKRQYFLPVKDQVDQSMFSTKESATERYKIMRSIYASSAITFMILYAAIYKDSKLSDAWFSDHVFNLEGGEFWKTFFTELPLVALKLIPALLVPVLIVWYSYLVFRSRAMHKKALKNL